MEKSFLIFIFISLVPIKQLIQNDNNQKEKPVNKQCAGLP